MTEQYRCELTYDPYGISHKEGSLDECVKFILAEEESGFSMAVIKKKRNKKAPRRCQ